MYKSRLYNKSKQSGLRIKKYKKQRNVNKIKRIIANAERLKASGNYLKWKPANEGTIQVETYKDYVRSPHWQSVKQQFFASKHFSGKCFICGTDKLKFEIHHLTYENKDQELLEDLVALCKCCHHDVHFEKGVRLWLTQETIRGRVFMLKRKYGLKENN